VIADGDDERRRKELMAVIDGDSLDRWDRLESDEEMGEDDRSVEN